jgi:hypothetical protein
VTESVLRADARASCLKQGESRREGQFRWRAPAQAFVATRSVAELERRSVEMLDEIEALKAEI